MPTKAQLEAKVKDLEAEIEGFRQFLSVESSVRAALPDLAELEVFDRARAAVALNLAAQLDSMASAGAEFVKNPPAPAPVAKELRSILADLEAKLGDGDDDSIFADLSASMGD